MKLTPEGQRFLQRCAPAVEALETAATEIQDEREALQGRLRITSTTAFGRDDVLPLIASFQSEHPELEIELSLSDGFVDLVAEDFDLAIRGGILPDSEYIARLLVPVTPLVCASPDYLNRRGVPQSVADLNGHRLIGMRSNPSQPVFAWEFAGSKPGEMQRVEIAPTAIMNDPACAARAAALGMGITQVGSNVALPLFKTGKLSVLFPEIAIQSRGLYAVYPSKRFAPKKLTAFADHLVEAFAHRADLVFS